MAKKPFPVPKLTTYEDILGLSSEDNAKEEIVYIPYQYLRRSPYQYRDKGLTKEQIQEQVESLAFDIEVDGKIQQPCIVRERVPPKANCYEIVVGHHRILAAEYLTEVKGVDGFKEVPCIVRVLSDAQAEYLCNSSNNLRPKTDYQIMHELETKMRLLKEHPEEFPHLQGPGRMVDKLAKEMHLSKSTVGEYLQISKNLSDNAMESFETGEINKSAAVSLSSLSHDEQDKLIGAGVTKQKDIKAYKEEQTEKKTHRTTITDTVKTVKTHSVSDNVSNLDKDDAIEVEKVIPGQLRLANTDMELEEETAVEENKEDAFHVDSTGRCTCPSCNYPSRIEDIFVFYGTRYCMNCLHKLIQDMEDTGVITLDRSSIDSNGIIVRT